MVSTRGGMGFGIEVRDGVREKEKLGCEKVNSWKEHG